MRLALKPVEWFTFQTAVFQGDVFPQNVNRYGFNWRLNENVGYFLIDEAQFRWNHGEKETGLPGQFKVGSWFDTATFENLNTGGTAYGDYGVYFVVDQMLWRKPTPALPSGKNHSGKDVKKEVIAEKSDQGLGWFGRLDFEPQDRNFVSFYFDTGLSYKGLIPTRDNDTIGLAFAYAQLSHGAQQQQISAGSTGVGAEMVLEATYLAQITKWLSIQPDLQFVINPGGNQDLQNALIIGARVTVVF